VSFGKPLDFSSYWGKEGDRTVLRTVTDEVMSAIVELSGQERADDYASHRKPAALPDQRAADEGDEDLSEELTG
jgi:1-acyl-sn-glycerol-3-phosphate acyltransferase